MTIPLTPRTRRVVQAVLYESLAVGFVAPVLTLVYDQAPVSALGLTVTMSLIALLWNYGFNAVFERWESRQAIKRRSWPRRLVHGALFEGGLAMILVPVMALWLGVSLWQAFIADIGILLFFLVYTVLFTWLFDHIFGLPGVAATPPP
jgi:uncharacterized membrane protein